MWRALVWEKGAVRRITKRSSLAPAALDPKKPVWIDLSRPDGTELAYLKEKLKLHPLVLEDMGNERQRPKVEPYDRYTYIVVKVFENGHSGTMAQLNLVLGDGYLLTVRSKSMPFLDQLWERAEDNPGILGRGADFALYSVLDAFVDSLFPVINELDLELDIIGEKVFKNTTPEVLSKLFQFKRRLFKTRKTVLPLRDALALLERHDNPQIRKENSAYFRDVYDHVLRIIDSLDTDRDIMTSTMDGYLSSVSNNLNVIMKKLTAITLIFMAPTLIAGIYGMNFPDLPEFEIGGIKVAFFLMAASMIAGFAYFKWRGWL